MALLGSAQDEKHWPKPRTGVRCGGGRPAPAAVVFDSGHTAYGFVEISEPQRPDQLGVEIGGEEAPLDTARQVRAWEPHRAWPLTVSWGILAGLALSVLMISGVLFSNPVSDFFPRLIVGLAGSAVLGVTLSWRFPDNRENN